MIQALQRLSRREKIMLAAGGASLVLFGLYMSAGGSDETAVVELVAAPPAAPPVSTPAAAPPAPAGVPAPSAEGLMLKGVMGASAIFRTGEGQEKAVAIGREAAPGLRLKELGVTHAILASAGGDLRLELGRAGASAVGGAAGTAAGARALNASASIPQDQARETLGYRLGLQPVKANGQVTGYAMKPGIDLPRLRAAGLQAGDVLLSVNGSRLNEEQVMELAWTAANSNRTEIEYLRGGRRMTAALQSSR